MGFLGTLATMERGLGLAHLQRPGLVAKYRQKPRYRRVEERRGWIKAHKVGLLQGRSQVIARTHYFLFGSCSYTMVKPACFILVPFRVRNRHLGHVLNLRICIYHVHRRILSHCLFKYSIAPTILFSLSRAHHR